MHVCNRFVQVVTGNWDTESIWDHELKISCAGIKMSIPHEHIRLIEYELKLQDSNNVEAGNIMDEYANQMDSFVCIFHSTV